MTSSIKPEVHNVSLHRQRRTEPRPIGNKRKKLGEAKTCSSEDMITNTHTHTHTHTRLSQHSAVRSEIRNCAHHRNAVCVNRFLVGGLLVFDRVDVFRLHRAVCKLVIVVVVDDGAGRTRKAGQQSRVSCADSVSTRSCICTTIS